jgi:hypothetical protein
MFPVGMFQMPQIWVACLNLVIYSIRMSPVGMFPRLRIWDACLRLATLSTRTLPVGMYRMRPFCTAHLDSAAVRVIGVKFVRNQTEPPKHVWLR